MKPIQLISIILLCQSCSNTPEYILPESPEDVYKIIDSIQTESAIFEKSYFKTDNTSLDTFEIGYANNCFVQKALNDFDDCRIMQLYWVSNFNLKKKKEISLDINYDEIGDSIQFFQRDTYDIDQIKTYKIDGRNYQIIKQKRSFFSKSRRPNRYHFYCKEFGYVALSAYGWHKRLKKFENRELAPPMNSLIEKLVSDKEFYKVKE